MTDQEFLQLAPAAANNFALGKAPDEYSRLRKLYRDANGVQIDDREVSASPSSAMSTWGGWLVALGIIGALASFFFPVGVETLGVYDLPREVANIDKIALRHMCMAASLGLFIGGCVMLGAGHVAKAIRASNPPSPS